MGERIVDPKTIHAYARVDIADELDGKEFGSIGRQRCEDSPSVQEVSSIGFDLRFFAMLSDVSGGNAFGDEPPGLSEQEGDQSVFMYAKCDGLLDGVCLCEVEKVIGGLDHVGGEELELSIRLEQCEMLEEHWGY